MGANLYLGGNVVRNSAAGTGLAVGHGISDCSGFECRRCAEGCREA
jgi:hypothetical protein